MDITARLLHVGRRDLLMSWASEATATRGPGRLLASTTKNYLVDIFRYWHHYETQSDDLVGQYGD